MIYYLDNIESRSDQPFLIFQRKLDMKKNTLIVVTARVQSALLGYAQPDRTRFEALSAILRLTMPWKVLSYFRRHFQSCPSSPIKHSHDISGTPLLLRFHANQTRSYPSRSKRAKEAYKTGRPFISHLKRGCWLVSVDLQLYWHVLYTGRKLVPPSETHTRLWFVTRQTIFALYTVTIKLFWTSRD
jgi:hypothetical protein